MIVNGYVSSFSPEMRFGFVDLEQALGEAYFDEAMLARAGHAAAPVGTAMRVRVKVHRGRLHVAEVLECHASAHGAAEGDGRNAGAA